MNRPYPQYRDSRVEWLGFTPEHWKVHRLGFALAAVVGGGTPDTSNEAYWAEVDEEGMPWVAISDMSAGGTVLTTKKRVTSLGLMTARLQPLSPDTVIYSMYATVGAVARLGIRAVTNQAILGLLPGESLLRSFLYWWLTGIRQPVLAVTRSNTQSNLNAETVGKLPLALPPLDEQRAISDFLERETSRVDALARRYRRLIERLEEYRTALITRTVTKGLPPAVAREVGLDPNPSYRDSGVGWLGEVPAHWQVERLGHVASYRVSSVDKKTMDGEMLVRLCNYTDVYYGDRIRASNRGFMKATASAHEIAQYGLTEGDVVITKDSEDWKDIAVPALIDETADDFVCGYHLGIIRPSQRMYPAFFFRVMQSTNVNQELQVSASGVTRYGLPIAAVTEASVPVPPLTEQQAIAEFLDHEMGRVDGLVSHVETALERLEEYRTALITAVVTGKIDVRNETPVERNKVPA